MAEVTGLRNNALPYPIYGAPWGIVFPLLDADGDPVSPSSPDSEISKNGDTFADCTNEATEIATSSGSCYLLLTATEMTADVIVVQIKSTGAKTTVVTLYPRKLVTVRSGTSASGGVSTSTIVLDASASAVDDFYNGMVCIATIDTNVEVRVISDYTGSTQTATVVPDWNVAPDNNDTFIIKLPEGAQVNQANVTHIAGTAQTARDIGASVLISSGTGTGQLSVTSGVIASNVTQFGGSNGTFASGRPEVNLTHIAGSSVSTSTAQLGVNLVNIAGSAVNTSSAQLGVNVVNAGGTAWASGSLTSGVFATGAITATAIAADAIGASELASDAATEIATAVWASGTRVLTANTNLNDPTAAAIADAVWDEAQADHVGAGSFGLIASEIADILVDTAEIGAAGAGLTEAGGTGDHLTAINLPDQTMNITGDITGNLSGSVGSVTGAVGSVTGLTAADVGAIKTVTDKLDDTLEDDAGTFRFTTNSLEQAPTGGSAPSAADIRAEIDANSTQLAAIVEDTGTTLDGKINAIKAKTDSLTFTVANQVDSNIKSVAGTTVTGSGTAGDPWGP